MSDADNHSIEKAIKVGYRHIDTALEYGKYCGLCFAMPADDVGDLGGRMHGLWILPSSCFGHW